jgi:hypothetical protein
MDEAAGGGAMSWQEVIVSVAFMAMLVLFMWFNTRDIE